MFHNGTKGDRSPLRKKPEKVNKKLSVYDKAGHGGNQSPMVVDFERWMNETLDFILNSMGGNFQRLERTQIMLDKDVQLLLSLISQRDSKGLKDFLEEHASDAIQIVLSCLSLYSR